MSSRHLSVEPLTTSEESSRTAPEDASGSSDKQRHASHLAAAARLLIEGQSRGKINLSRQGWLSTVAPLSFLPFHRNGASAAKRSAVTVRASLARRAWLFSVLAIALLVGQLPSLLAMCCAPAGATGLGTVWFVNDFAQYESAMRQGAEQAGWLIHDPFTAEAHQ